MRRLFPLLAFALIACADPPLTASAPDAGAPSTMDSGTLADGGAALDATVSSSCARVALTNFELDSLDDVSIRYRADVEPNLGEAVRDELWFDVLRRADFPTSTGTFALGIGFNANFATCTHCPLIVEDRVGSAAPRRIYFPRAGELTLTQDPFSFTLQASLRGLRFVEVTIGGEFLESTPVPGGRCVDVEDVEVNYRFVPKAWVCGAERWSDGAVCDCGCGAADFDCYPGIPTTLGCDANEACVEDRCIDRCSAFSPERSCASGFCGFSEWGDLCTTDAALVDPAPLGGRCSTPGAVYCALENGLPRGMCDDFARADFVCKPVCRTDADCVGGDRLSCLTRFTERGFCEQRFPVGWTCSAQQFEDGRSCDCGCGVADTVDCQSELPLAGCALGEGCTLEGRCVAAPPGDACADAVRIVGTSTTVHGTTVGAADDLAIGPGTGRCLEGDQQGPDVFYRIELSAGQTLNLALRPEAHDAALYLLGPGAVSDSCSRAVERCALGADSGRDGGVEQLAFTAVVGGTYVIVVDSFWVASQGRFALDVEIR